MILTAFISFLRKSIRAVQAAQLRRARVQLALHGYHSTADISDDRADKR